MAEKASSSSNSSCACGKTSAQSCQIQNGKGDAPRNMSEGFRNNYEGINWGSKDRIEGRKEVKVY